jgi:hypothetical protein
MRWYSILDSEADAMPSIAAKPAQSGTGNVTKPRPTSRPKPVSLKRKPESDVSQYFIVQNEGVFFEPFRYGSRDLDTDASFEMYSGAVLRVLKTVDSKHYVLTDSGEEGAISTKGLRPLSSKEKEQMASGISKGKSWYSILDTAPAG